MTIVLWKQGILHDAFYWTIADHDVPHVFWQKGIVHTLTFLGVCLPLVIGAILACRDKDEIWAGKTAERTALLGLLAALSDWRCSRRPLLPSLLCPINSSARTARSTLLRATLVPQDAAAPMVPATWSDLLAWLALTIIVFSIKHWTGLAPRRVPSEAGRYLFAHSDPADRIFVWGQSPDIYLDAHRRPACRYITTFPLTGYVFGGPIPGFDTRSRILPGAWTTLEQDFARHPPTYIVDVQPDPKSAYYPVKDFPILAKLLAERYEPVAHTAEGVIYRMR